MNEECNIYGKYGCWWEGGTGVSPEGNQCGECYPQWEDKCPHLKKSRQIEEMAQTIHNRLPRFKDCEEGECIADKIYDKPCWCVYKEIAEMIYNAGYRKQSEVIAEIVDEFKQIAKQFVLDRDLYLVVFKNALDYAETELKNKYAEKTNENNT